MFKRLVEDYFERHTPQVSRDKIAGEVRKRNEDSGAQVAARYSRGNVSIQMGEMIFKEDIGPAGAKPPRGYSALARK